MEFGMAPLYRALRGWRMWIFCLVMGPTFLSSSLHDIWLRLVCAKVLDVKLDIFGFLGPIWCDNCIVCRILFYIDSPIESVFLFKSNVCEKIKYFNGGFWQLKVFWFSLCNVYIGYSAAPCRACHACNTTIDVMNLKQI